MTSPHRAKVTLRRKRAQKRGPTPPKVRQPNPLAKRVAAHVSRQERIAKGRALSDAQRVKEHAIGIHPRYQHPRRAWRINPAEWEKSAREYDRAHLAT